jgi:mono/diheme cytochrome c family protein
MPNMHITYSIKLFIAGFLCLAATVSRAQNGKWVAPSYADTIHNPLSGSSARNMEAHGIYSRVCAQCHGYQGKGDGPVAGSLKIKPANHSSPEIQKQSDGALFWKISEGRGQMAPFKETLTADQRWALVNFIRTLKAQ